MKISLLLHTASPDNFLSHHGIPSAAAMICAELERQDFPKSEFELVYVDRWHDGQPWLFDRIGHSFQVKHVPIHPEHRYWYDRGLCFISAAKNTGILYADGELLITFDDGAVYNTTDFLSHYWHNFHGKGLLLNACYCRWDTVEVSSGLPVYPLRGKQRMNDTRVFMGHRFEHDRGNWLFTGSSFPLQTALALNGFNERMDGMKSLEDCEFGIRLARYGCRFVMDQSVYCHILAHGNNDRKNPLIDGHDPNPPLKEELYTEIRSEISKENYGVLEWAQELGQIRANEGPITPEHLECIQRSTLKYRFFDPLAAENEERLARWLATPTFNLLQHRIELRSSSLWKW